MGHASTLTPVTPLEDARKYGKVVPFAVGVGIFTWPESSSLMNNDNTSDVFIGSGQVAQLYAVSGETIRRWVSEGRLVAQRQTLGGHLRFRLSYIRELLSRNNGSRPPKPPPRQSTGQGLVEFAIVLPLLLLFILGFLALANTFRQVNAMNNAADSGAFYASLGHPADQVTAHVRRRLDEQLVDPDRVQITIHPPTYSYGDPVTVAITKSMDLKAVLWEQSFPLPVHSTQIVQKQVITGGSP